MRILFKDADGIAHSAALAPMNPTID